MKHLVSQQMHLVAYLSRNWITGPADTPWRNAFRRDGIDGWELWEAPSLGSTSRHVATVRLK